jgi:hypothetical protein
MRNVTGSLSPESGEDVVGCEGKELRKNLYLLVLALICCKSPVFSRALA